MQHDFELVFPKRAVIQAMLPSFHSIFQPKLILLMMCDCRKLMNFGIFFTLVLVIRDRELHQISLTRMDGKSRVQNSNIKIRKQ